MLPNFPKAPEPVARYVAGSSPSHPANLPQRTASSGSCRPEGAPASAPMLRVNSTNEIQPRHVVLAVGADEARAASNLPPARSQSRLGQRYVARAVIAAAWNSSPMQEIIYPIIHGVKAVVEHLRRVANEASERRFILSEFNNKPYADQVYENFEILLDKARETAESVDSQEIHSTNLREQLKDGLADVIKTPPEFRGAFANLAGSLNQSERIDAAEKIASHGVVGPVLTQVLAKEIEAASRSNTPVSNPSESLVRTVSHRWENRRTLAFGRISFGSESHYLAILEAARSMRSIQSQPEVISPLAKVLLEGSPTNSKNPDEVLDQFIQEARAEASAFLT
jgi:hypothetical protein